MLFLKFCKLFSIISFSNLLIKYISLYEFSFGEYFTIIDYFLGNKDVRMGIKVRSTVPIPVPCWTMLDCLFLTGIFLFDMFSKLFAFGLIILFNLDFCDLEKFEFSFSL